MPTRIDGQIWLGTEVPSNLRYYADQTEYWVIPAPTYVATTTLKKGTLVAPDPNTAATVISVVPAVWPRDKERIIGIVLSNTTANQPVRVMNYGFVEFDRTALEACFVTGSDLNVAAALTGANYYSAFGTMTDGGAGNGWEDTTQYNGRGAPIYWFSGRTLKTAGGYGWQDPSSYAGKLTFATPSGYRQSSSSVIPWGDASLDVAYKGLPVIGNVLDYSYNSSTKQLETLSVHVNFSRFQGKIRFEYPYNSSSNNGLGYYDASPDPETITIRHGLFNNAETPHVSIDMWGYTSNVVETETSGEESNRVYPGFDSFIGAAVDKRTEVEIASDTPFYYKVLGEVSYVE